MDLKRYVEYYRTHGYSDEQLEEHLVKQGFKEEDVHAALKTSNVPWFLLSVIISIVILFAVGVYFFMDVLSANTSPEVPQNILESNSPSNSLPDITEDFCEGKACAEEAFQACEPGVGSYSMFLAEIEYEVLGPKDDYCEVYVNLKKAPKKELEGKDMTCLLDPELPIEDALDDLSRCQGPLVQAYAQIS